MVGFTWIRNAVSGRALGIPSAPSLGCGGLGRDAQPALISAPQAAADFTRQGGHQALEQQQSTPELRERAQALLDGLRQPPGTPSACQATLPAFS